MSESTTSVSEAKTRVDETSIRWPPPGLERMQGDLVRVAIRAALGSLILVLPLLFVLGRDMDFATLGPFADAWWVTLVLAIAGLTFAADALVRTMTLLRRVSKALDRGYDLSTVRMVLADGDRDMGFLLSGSRYFAVLDSTERNAIAEIRVFAITMYSAAGIWMPNALALGIFLGARGWISPTDLWMGTLFPSLVLYLFGAVAGTVAETRVRRAKRAWYQNEWVEDLASDEARSWRNEVTERAGLTLDRPEPGGSRMIGHASVAMGALALMVAVPILTLVPTAAIGPILAELAIPRFENVRSRAAHAEALRPYRVATDPSVSPAEAGQLLHDLTYVGTDREPPPGEAEPSRRIARPWLPDAGESNPMGVPPYLWSDSLLRVVADGITDEQRVYLTRLASHPGRELLSRLASAPSIDVASARLADPLPDGISLASMPLPRLGDLRGAANTHLAAAALSVVDGRPEEAEELIAELISVGLLLGDGGPTLMDNLAGFVLVEAGAGALADLFVVTEQPGRAAALATLRGTAERAVARSRYRYPEGAEAWVQSLPAMVADENLPRGLRWEFFTGVTTLTPCINLKRLVFGPDDEYLAFLADARANLVDWPSEEPIYELARGGWVQSGGEVRWIGRVLTLAMRGGEGSCGDFVQRLEASQVLF